MAPGIFDKYNAQVRKRLGFESKSEKENGPPKSLAIAYSEHSPAFDGVTVVERLYGAMAHDGWTKNKDKGTNWHWREEGVDPIPDSGNKVAEVPLERTIAARRDEQQKEWTWQMSTSSGVQNLKLGDKHNAPNKRRSIDLVRNHGNDCYSFVELKVGADNPLHALFEILGYALAYLHARNGKCKGTGKHDVMQAKQIKLVVLGPLSWYEYKHKNDPQSYTFDLKWLADTLAEGLNALSKKNPKFSIAFEVFGEHENLGQAAADIIDLANKW